MPTNYLPRLKPSKDDRLISPHAGTWSDDQAKKRLEVLASAIEDQSRAKKIHSIPDPWSRVILFTRALLEPTHPLHLQTIGEWRGVLAILGLKHIRGFTELAAQPVVLDEAGTSGTFLATIARVRPIPRYSLVQGSTWDSFHVLRWHGQSSAGAPRAFGLTSPTTLVATGASYADVFQHTEVPWFVNGVLVDPITPLPDTDEPPGNLSAQERESLAQWILYLRAELLKLAPGDLTRHGKVVEYLQEYANELKQGAKPCGLDGLEDNGLGLHEPEMYRALSMSRKRNSPTLTDLQIVETRTGGKTYVLYDPALARQFRPARKDRDVTFFETDTLASAPRIHKVNEGKSGLLRRDAKTGQEIMWCNKSFFFQEDLIYDQVETIPGEQGGYSNTFPGCRAVTVRGRAENRNIALPLTEDAARLFTPDYLAENFSIEWLMGGGAKCVLKMKVRPLSNAPGAPDGPVSEVELDHTYERKDMNKINLLPVVCVWPDFRFADSIRDRWKRYFLFETWPNTGRADEFVVTPLDPVEEVRPPVVQTSGVFQIAVTNRFPEVLVCRMPFTANKPRANDNNPPKGLLLLKPPVLLSDNQGKGAALGVDFGTTGTTIYTALLDAEGQTHDIEPMRFHDRVLQVTARAEDELKQLTRHHFIPSKINASGKMLSVFQTHGSNGGRTALLDGHALFQNADTNAPDPFVWGEPNSIITNLKWGSEPREAQAAEAFLSQLCIQAIAEQVAAGANSVDVRYSYPTAFDQADLDRVRSIWEMVLKEVQEVTSVRVTPNLANSSNYEAVAAARYFASPEVGMAFTRGALTLDIGGGTTDLALWNMANDSPSLIAHSSVLFAGKDMFQAVLRRNLKLLKEIEPDLHLPTLDSKKYSFASDAELDALIAIHGNDLLGRLPQAMNVSDSVREFIAILELGMSGIAFYAGLLLGHLIQNKSYDVSEAEQLQVFVGGNAARLLHWCDLGNFRKGTSFYQRFCDAILAGGQVGAPDALKGKSIEVTISPLPKEEVAYGLVAKFEGIEKMKDYSNPIAGEDYRVGEEDVHSWQEAPDVPSVLSGRLRVKRDLPVFSRFLQVIGEQLTPGEKESLAGSINDTLTQMKEALKKHLADPKLARQRQSGEQLNPGRKQPLFIIALKKLIDMRINRLVKNE